MLVVVDQVEVVAVHHKEIGDRQGYYMQQKRQGLIVWYQHKKNIKKIMRFGHVLYTSKKLKYAVLYVNQEDIEEVEERLLRLPFISKVDHSEKPFIRVDYDSKEPEIKKEYDYHVGI